MQSSDALDITKLLALAFAGLLWLILPLAGQLLCRSKGARWRNFWVGAAFYILAVVLLEQGLHMIAFWLPLGGIILGNIWLYALYGALMTALFEETGRYVPLSILRHQLPSPWDWVSFGLGCGCCQMLMLLMLAVHNDPVLFWNGVQGGPSPAVTLVIQTLAGSGGLAQLPTDLILWSGLERLSALLLHVLNATLLYHAALYYRRSYILLALAFHFVLDFVMVILQPFVPLAVLELVVLLLVLLMAAGGAMALRPILWPPKPKEEQRWDDWLN